MLLAAGLVFAASLAVAFAGLLAIAWLRQAWGRLTGRPVRPFAFRIDPRQGFDRVWRSRVRERAKADVTDVEPK